MITPEAVVLELPTAGVATRAFARLMDLFVQLAIFAVLANLLFLSSFVGVSPVLIIAVVIFFVLLVVPIGMEILWRGRSVGKAVFGLRVVGRDGAPEAPRQAIVRGLVALVDLYLSLGSVAIICAMFGTSSQRAGDLSAGTVVIRARNSATSYTPIAFHAPAGYEHYVASLDVGLLDDEDFTLIREFLLRVKEFAPAARTELATNLAESTRARIRHTLPGAIDPELWLVCVASAYQLRRGGLLADAAQGLAPIAPLIVAPPRQLSRRERRRAS
ncbi:hypothetical protein BH10ACT3_BH10ACT3_14700 [soil metagenome]